MKRPKKATKTGLAEDARWAAILAMVRAHAEGAVLAPSVPSTETRELMRLSAHQRVLRDLAPRVSELVATHVVLERDRARARIEVEELLLDACDIGLGQRDRTLTR